MSWLYRRSYLIVHLLLGLSIIGTEVLYRWIMQTYQIHVRTCPDVFYIEFKQLHPTQPSNWMRNQLNHFVEAIYSLNDQCSTRVLKSNFNSIFRYFRYVWLSVTSLYTCLAVKHHMEAQRYRTKVR